MVDQFPFANKGDVVGHLRESVYCLDKIHRNQQDHQQIHPQGDIKDERGIEDQGI